VKDAANGAWDGEAQGDEDPEGGPALGMQQGMPQGMPGCMGMNPMMFAGMNPMMMGMNPMMAARMNPMMMMGMNNPMMGMNPMMMGMNPMMAAAQMCAANSANAAQQQQQQQPTLTLPDAPPTDTVDPRVKALCRDFCIDDQQVCRQLHNAMTQREDYDDDIQALYQVMERATQKGKKPLEIMLAKIREIKAGRFAGKELLDKDIWAFAEKYDLDDRVLNRLIKTLNMRRDTKLDDLKALDARLGNASQPTGLGLLVRLLEGLEETGRLPSPPRRLGGSGTFHPTGTYLHPSGPRGARHGSRDRADERDSEHNWRGSDRRRSRSRERRR